MSDDRLPQSATPSYDAVAAGSTLSAIAVALAAVVRGYGDGNQHLSILLLLGGFMSLWASAVALNDIYCDIRDARGTATYFLIFVALGLVITAIAYVWFLIWIVRM